RARADDAPAGRSALSVNVQGHATATADAVELEFTVEGSGEESSEARKRYREKLGHVLAALKKAAEKGEDRETRKKRSPEDKDDDGEPRKKGKADKGDKADDRDETPAAAIPVEVTEHGLVFGPKPPKPEPMPQQQVLVIGGGGGNNADK